MRRTTFAVTPRVIENRAEAERFLQRLRETEDPRLCCHGHYDCSDRRGGPCLDETLSNFPELAEG